MQWRTTDVCRPASKKHQHADSDGASVADSKDVAVEVEDVVVSQTVCLDSKLPLPVKSSVSHPT